MAERRTKLVRRFGISYPTVLSGPPKSRTRGLTKPAFSKRRTPAVAPPSILDRMKPDLAIRPARVIPKVPPRTVRKATAVPRNPIPKVVAVPKKSPIIPQNVFSKKTLLGKKAIPKPASAFSKKPKSAPKPIISKMKPIPGVAPMPEPIKAIDPDGPVQKMLNVEAEAAAAEDHDVNITIQWPGWPQMFWPYPYPVDPAQYGAGTEIYREPEVIEIEKSWPWWVLVLVAGGTYLLVK